MKFSLVLATFARTEELRRLLSSLNQQEYRNFEVIIVDQNRDERLGAMLAQYAPVLEVQRVRSERGLSRARNAGLRHELGDVIAFPDDDCWYPPDLIQQVAIRLCEHLEWDGVAGRAVDANRRSVMARWDRHPGFITRSNLWRRHISFSIFLRRRVIKTVGLFDESLGVGAGTRWGSGEETDYLLSALEQGFRIFYDPSVAVFHSAASSAGAPASNKTHSYALGMGRVLRKHHYSPVVALYFALRPLAGTVLKAITGRFDEAFRYWLTFRGRVEGYLAKR